MLRDLYYKIIELLKSVFNKKEVMMLNSGKDENQNSKIETHQIKNEFLQSLKTDTEADRLLSLQEKIESGKIDESELSKEEVNKLKKLYYKQIEKIYNSINNYRNRIAESKN